DFGSPVKGGLGDAHIVCGNNYRIESLRFLTLLPDASQKSLSSNQMQRFSRKTRRTPARWNNADGLIHNGRPERSEAESKDPEKLDLCNATGFLDFARNDVMACHPR